ncbi:hypothetical protein ACWOA0_06700 [Ignavigranum ruoffiae]|uniref:Uncharacterized protein n=1 Tax=Ignavigranum ruoffiae TaxID=89093 RepID=A0A1H9FC29_9LACT|nr:hypothetical protein [Ignavigranum ruoffiae]SEQ35484.1 hypothetical protein SAMN04488558_1092 [Ignavigranum ruoffiae]
MNRINARKKIIKNQKYEEYWKITLAFTDFYSDQFVNTLRLIIDHIDKYNLSNQTISQLKDKQSSRVNESVVHYKELVKTISKVYQVDDKSGATTRKQINTYIKLGFIKPYLRGYVDAAKEYIKPNQTRDNRQRLFSDTVYEYSSFNCSVTNDDSDVRNVKFLVNTLLNSDSKVLEMNDLIGMMFINIRSLKRNYAKKKEIVAGFRMTKQIDFKERKYNQMSHFRSVLRNLTFIKCIGKKEDFKIALLEDAKTYLPNEGSTSRDAYRFMLMKKAVYEESIKIYGHPISWLSKSKQEGLVVSHIYPSAIALKNWEIDKAYDPNNALLLLPGDEDQYFDKNKMTFDQSGRPIFSDFVREDFREYVIENNIRLDQEIYNSKRKEYMLKHNAIFNNKT